MDDILISTTSKVTSIKIRYGIRELEAATKKMAPMIIENKMMTYLSSSADTAMVH